MKAKLSLFVGLISAGIVISSNAFAITATELAAMAVVQCAEGQAWFPCVKMAVKLTYTGTKPEKLPASIGVAAVSNGQVYSSKNIPIGSYAPIGLIYGPSITSQTDYGVKMTSSGQTCTWSSFPDSSFSYNNASVCMNVQFKEMSGTSTYTYTCTVTPSWITGTCQ